MNRLKSCPYSERLLKKIYELNKASIPTINIPKIKHSIYYAKKYHGQQKRDTGEPYYSHPINVADMLTDFYFDTNAIVAAILHDTIEDTNATIEDISCNFGVRVAEIVARLTRFKLPNSNFKISSEQLIIKSYKLKDPVVVLIKLLDRLDNLKTIYIKDHETQVKTYKEVLRTFYLLSFKLDYRIVNQFQNYLNSITQKQVENEIFSYGVYQLEIPKLQSNF